MSSRLSVLLLAVCLLLGLAACSKKPETADNQQQQPPATAPDNSANAPATTQSPANTTPPMQQAQTQVALRLRHQLRHHRNRRSFQLER